MLVHVVDLLLYHLDSTYIDSNIVPQVLEVVLHVQRDALEQRKHFLVHL